MQHYAVPAELVDSHSAGTFVYSLVAGPGIGTETCEVDIVSPGWALVWFKCNMCIDFALKYFLYTK